MKFILDGKAKSKPFVLSMITEDKLKNIEVLNKVLIQYNVKIEKVETIDGQKVIYLVDSE